MKIRERIKRHRKPSFNMGNTSVIKNVDEVIALVNSQYAFGKCSMLCIMETRLNGNIPDSLFEQAGFALVWSDKGKVSDNKRGEDLAVFSHFHR